LFLHCVLAICGTVYCNQSCLWVCVCVCGFVYFFTGIVVFKQDMYIFIIRDIGKRMSSFMS